MLSRPATMAPTPARWSTRLAAGVPTARVARPALVATTVALASVPVLLTLVLGGEKYFAPLVLLGLATGASLGWAVDDPAAELLASTPVATSVRTLFRVAAAALVAGTGIALVLIAVAVGPGLPPGVRDRLPEAAAAAGGALAFGLVAARRGERFAGAGAVTGGVFGTAFVAGLSFKVHQLPSFLPSQHHDRWWLVTLVALAVAVHAGRDPARR